MIRDLDETIRALLQTRAPTGSELKGADIGFDLPDSEWRGGLDSLTVNCYLYDIRQNLELCTNEPLLQRSPDNTRAVYRTPPARIDCSYCITAWSVASEDAVLEEHRVLSQVLEVLLRHLRFPTGALKGSLASQIPPYPTAIAARDGMKNQPEFWGALDQRYKPSINYTVTLAMMLDEPPADMPHVVDKVGVKIHHMDGLPE